MCRSTIGRTMVWPKKQFSKYGYLEGWKTILCNWFLQIRYCIVEPFFKGPNKVGLEEKNFKTKVLGWLENAILILVFANTVNTSYTFVQYLHRNYIEVNFKNDLLLTML